MKKILVVILLLSAFLTCPVSAQRSRSKGNHKQTFTEKEMRRRRRVHLNKLGATIKILNRQRTAVARILTVNDRPKMSPSTRLLLKHRAIPLGRSRFMDLKARRAALDTYMAKRAMTPQPATPSIGSTPLVPPLTVGGGATTGSRPLPAGASRGIPARSGAQPPTLTPAGAFPTPATTIPTGSSDAKAKAGSSTSTGKTTGGTTKGS